MVFKAESSPSQSSAGSQFALLMAYGHFPGRPNFIHQSLRQVAEDLRRSNADAMEPTSGSRLGVAAMGAQVARTGKIKNTFDQPQLACEPTRNDDGSESGRASSKWARQKMNQVATKTKRSESVEVAEFWISDREVSVRTVSRSHGYSA